MSAQANVETVKKMFAAFVQKDIATILNGVSDDVEWTLYGPDSIIPQAGTRRGRKEVEQFFAILEERAVFESFEPQEFIAEGSQVVALGSYRTLVKATGKRVTNHWAMVFEFSENGVRRWRSYEDSYETAKAYSPD